MSEFQGRLAQAAKQAETWGKRVVLTAEVAAHVAGPLAAPTAQQADLLEATPSVEMSQDILQEQQEDWAENDLNHREQQAARTDVARQQTTSQMIRGSRAQQPQRSKERSRER